MLYSKTSNPAAAADPIEEETNFQPGGDVAGWGLVSERLSDIRARSGEPSGAAEGSASRRAELEGLEGSAQAALARLQEEQQSRKLRQQSSIDAEGHARRLETTPMTPMTPAGPGNAAAVAGGDAWEQLAPSAAALRIKDLDFSDLLDDEDIDVLDNMDAFDSSSSSVLTVARLRPYTRAPGRAQRSPQQKKKTVKLFWKELKQNDAAPPKCRFGRGTVWASLDKVAVDTSRLEHLFESKAKELVIAKKGPETKKAELLVLDSKRSNAINIGMTVLPAVHVIKTAILNYDEFAISKEGIEKILTMTPTDEEKQKIQEAQLANPDVPLGTAEQFLFSLASISALTPRLQLWAFKLNYEALEKEIAEPLFDLKLGMEQLASNQTFRRILATLLAIGNFLNSSNNRPEGSPCGPGGLPALHHLSSDTDSLLLCSYSHLTTCRPLYRPLLLLCV
ncbi:hypothetical protein PFLUV_G00278140 [Perca fluviatilis]|uniref:FH2 domain-containing protein n=1 Tax=Perca fluviatilis TaxID=8168 RepID=A0A6A5E0T0_PERFL|nr:hypothetical protein PFLUV_G00278140 [Perca fluviatilis]